MAENHRTFNSLRPAEPEFVHWPLVGKEELMDMRQTEDYPHSDHLHWGITAFRQYSSDGGGMTDSCLVEVEGPTEELAILRAMQIVRRANYRVSWVRETCSKDPTLKEDI